MFDTDKVHRTVHAKTNENDPTLMSFGFAERFMNLKLEDVTEEISDIRNVVRNVELGSWVEISL